MNPEIERYVPGVGHPVGAPRSARIEETEDDADRWDAHPLLKRTRGGEEIELFMVAALAAALHRSVHTIYKWEQKGFLPKALYGKKVAGALGAAPRRLYTRAQIEGLIFIAKAEGIYDARRNLDETRFAQRAAALFRGENAA